MWCGFWGVPVQGQELDFHDHWESLPAQDVLWLCDSVWFPSLQYCSGGHAGHGCNHRSLKTRIVLDWGRLQQYGTLFAIREQAEILHFVPLPSCSQKVLVSSHSILTASFAALIKWGKENLKERSGISYFNSLSSSQDVALEVEWCQIALRSCVPLLTWLSCSLTATSNSCSTE